ncbi:hypothetical protein EGW08_011345 [Elysia chlorotica]|uniref:Uncharacterized protein n=1 Tax=Elysia chlorotica TaxID=188477 RepID=A0A3S1BHJ7_ELYCH|nr:hypothetical protein EGW08_011345 [Elysia chlorotica]
MRKKIVVQIQDEIHVERDKRRQAELKMEMMEWENTHLRRLRKDLAVKDGTIETLEASLKEKDEIHDKLFRENVILPKTIAEARAREYEILHTKVQKYEKEADAKRNIESPNKLSKNNSVQLASNQPHYEDTKAPMKTIFQTQRQPEFGSSETCLLSDWDKSPSSTGSAMPPMLFASNLIDRTKTLLYSSKNWSNSSEKARIGEQVGEHYCKKEGSVQRDDWEKIQMGVKSPNLPSQAFSFKQNNNVDQQSLHTNRLSAVPGPFSEYSSHPLCNVEYDPGPLIPFTTFCNDDFPKGTQESDHKTAARRANTVTDQSGICERSFADKMFSRYQDGEVEDACCKSVSDGSIFASCGSDISDDDNRNVSRSLNHSYLTGHSRKHITSAATAKPFRRNTSPDMAVPLKRNMSKVRSRSKVKELHYEYSSFPNPVSKFNSAFEKNFYSREIVLSENTTSHAEIEAKQQFDTSYSEGRARPRRRMEIPRSQPPVTPDLRSSRGSEPISTAGNLGSQAPLPDMLLSENRPTLPPSHASSVIVNQAPNMKMYKKCTDPRQITYPISDYQAVSQMVDVNQSSTIARDADSEESWIVIGPPI